MPKSLVLRRRGGDSVLWHDAFVLQNAIEVIAHGKALKKAALFMVIAAKIQETQEGIEDFLGQLPDFTVELSNTQARVLWREMTKLEPEAFGRDRGTGRKRVPHPGLLWQMLEDFARQLGKALPKDEDLDLEGDEGDS